MTDTGHGSIGQLAKLKVTSAPAAAPTDPLRKFFSRMFDPPAQPFPAGKLAELARLMAGAPDEVKDGADPEENLWVPAGYTYFGQFVDHDLTFDSTSTLDIKHADPDPSRIPTNLRTPRLDLDCVYGDGPDAQPFMYASDGATLLYGGTGQPAFQTDPSGVISSVTATWDLLRAPNGRAIIGDKRNDENSIVCQIQLAMIKYHNTVVAKLKTTDPKTWSAPDQLFESARNEVRWTYQHIVFDDFLPRIIEGAVLADFQVSTRAQRAGAYVLYVGEDMRTNLPREFVGAAYRYGHSGVRTGYRLNQQTRLSIFPASDVIDQSADSLLGFEPLPMHHVIDNWGRFFPDSDPGADVNDTNRVAAADLTPNPAVQLQFAYKLDPTLVDPLTVLPPSVSGAGTTEQARKEIAPAKFPVADRPSLALLNLLRGNAYGLATGQTIANKLQSLGKGDGPLDPKYLVVRRPVKDGVFHWVTIDDELLNNTPLWFYVLAEGQKKVVDAVTLDSQGHFSADLLLKGDGARTQLGWVGGRIVAEVLYGLLDEDPDSFVNQTKTWKPLFFSDGVFRMRRLLDLVW